MHAAACLKSVLVVHLEPLTIHIALTGIERRKGEEARRKPSFDCLSRHSRRMRACELVPLEDLDVVASSCSAINPRVYSIWANYPPT
jgi:hypothetical protein